MLKVVQVMLNLIIELFYLATRRVWNCRRMLSRLNLGTETG